MQTFFTRLAADWQRFICRIREARRVRRDMGQLASMSAHELRDLGFLHSSTALVAAADMSSCCR
jgi:uncharacterized protein YjiS (DUF1127 family)